MTDRMVKLIVVGAVCLALVGLSIACVVVGQVELVYPALSAIMALLGYSAGAWRETMAPPSSSSSSSSSIKGDATAAGIATVLGAGGTYGAMQLLEVLARGGP